MSEALDSLGNKVVDFVVSSMGGPVKTVTVTDTEITVHHKLTPKQLRTRYVKSYHSFKHSAFKGTLYVACDSGGVHLKPSNDTENSEEKC